MRQREILFAVLSIHFAAIGSSVSAESKYAPPKSIDGEQSEICACLKEKRDLWLCGLADQPVPPYDSADRKAISDVLVQGAIINYCTENLEQFFLDANTEDEISPVRLSHEIDAFRKDGELLQRYNYLVYEFEKDGMRMGARSYLDEMESVSIFCPVMGDASLDCIAAPEFEQQVLDYLKRRYDVVKRFDVGAGYETLWTRSSEAGVE